ncbi:iron chelate uptake ABC transporter family permease subunit, partial [Erwinia rhapontici]
MNTPTDNRAAIAAHRAREGKRWRYVFLFLLLTALCLVLDIATGPSMLAPSEVIRSLTGIGERAAMTDAIVREFRLPMALMALVVGAALG